VNHDGRYAPSPTGPLHLGNLRTALLAWLFARSVDARFLIRSEDLDPDRSRAEWVGRQIADLAALGLDWDEITAQPSERVDRYAAAVDELREAGLIYECFCTRAEIREASSAPHGALPEGAYPGTCRELSEAERAARRSAGRPPALRVRAEGARVRFTDRLAGAQERAVDDFVVRRNDGAHGYNLAVALDDADQGIGEVVRGRDLLDSTPRQIWVSERLGLEGPRSWAHVPLVLGPDGARLAKRHGAVTLAERETAGESAAATLTLLAASLGLCEPGEPVSPAQLLERFDPRRLPAEDGPLPGLGADVHPGQPAS
jgi:glutamyl-tRNA synthetase